MGSVSSSSAQITKTQAPLDAHFGSFPGVLLGGALEQILSAKGPDGVEGRWGGR